MPRKYVIGLVAASAFFAAALVAFRHERPDVRHIAFGDLFLADVRAYRERVLPAALTRRLVVEAGVTLPWRVYAGPQGRVIGIDHFGASGKGPDLFKKFGITAEHVSRAILELVGGS